MHSGMCFSLPHKGSITLAKSRISRHMKYNYRDNSRIRNITSCVAEDFTAIYGTDTKCTQTQKINLQITYSIVLSGIRTNTCCSSRRRGHHLNHQINRAVKRDTHGNYYAYAVLQLHSYIRQSVYTYITTISIILTILLTIDRINNK